MLIHKFGGTSVANAARMLAVAEQVCAHARPALVITSAIAGVTDELIALGALAEKRDLEPCAQRREDLRARHLEALAAIVPKDPATSSTAAELDAVLAELTQLLQGVSLLQELTPRSLDLLLSCGERLAAPLLAAAIRAQGLQGMAVDARELIRTDARHGQAAVDLDASRVLCRKALLATAADVIPVVTGFIGRGPGGVTTTLGRGGSDYSAALVGAFVDADEIWIWTDVDGVMTADPRVVKEARVLEAVSYREAAEMAYFGSKVLHPSTMIPAVAQGIPFRIRNSLRPTLPGTRIAPSGDDQTFAGVKTVTSIADMALVTVEGRGMMGVPGMVGRVFAATARAEVNVFVISQASSEQNITFLVRGSDGARAVAELEREFETELARHRVERVERRDDVGVVAIIGEGMRGTPGISQRLFTAFGRAGINVLAIAQGSSELNVSVVVDQQDLRRAVGATHTAFGLTRDTHVFLLGKGLIGRTLLRQLLDSRQRLSAEHGLSTPVIGICGRDLWLHDPQGLDVAVLERVASGTPLDQVGGLPRPDDQSMLDSLAQSRQLDVVVVDVTAEETGDLHLAAVERGFHLVTANKKPLAGPLAQYRELRRLAVERGVGYHFETTFGAGLPVLFTLQDLLATHDRVRSVTGCFSGTLGYVCSQLEQGQPLSQIVRAARARGLTEPDPRDDLSGLDVARKALIIAREIGLALEMDDLELEPLLPAAAMQAADVEAFVDGLEALDQDFARRVEAEAQAGRVLRYLAEITPERVSVGLRAVAKDSAAGQLQGPDNLLQYRTERYAEHPLIIRGPGAGAEVTAAGVFGDILKIARRG